MRHVPKPLGYGFSVFFVFLCAAALVLSPLSGYQTAPSAPVPAQSIHSKQAPAILQTLVCGLWRVDRGFTSTIRIKNRNILVPQIVTPVLYMADGTEYDLPLRELEAGGIANIDVSQALAGAPPLVSSHLSDHGSAAVRYFYRAPGTVAAQIHVMDVAESLVFTYPFSLAASEPPSNHTLEGLWWKHDPGVEGFLNFTNTTDRQLEVSFQLAGSRGTALPLQSVTLAAHESQLLDLDSILLGLPEPEKRTGGIRVQYNGGFRDIVVAGGLENRKNGFSAAVPFLPHDSGSSEPDTVTYASVGLMVGKPDPAAGFPHGTQFAPYAVLRNTTSGPLQVSPALYWMAAGQPRSLALPPQNLAAFEAREIPLTAILAAGGLANYNGSVNLTLSLTGHHGDLVVATGSVDQTGTYVFEVPAEGVGESWAKDVAFWSVADGSDTMFTLWNPSDSPEDIVAAFSYGGVTGHYTLPIHLAPKGSQVISIAELIAAQQPDAEGNTIPMNVQEGSVRFEGTKGLTQPIHLVVSGGIFNVLTATCCHSTCLCCGVTFLNVYGDTTVAVGSTGHAYAQGWMSDGTFQDYTSSADWKSTNTAVADVLGGLITAKAAGSATIWASVETADGTIDRCADQFVDCSTRPFSNSLTVTVNCGDTRDQIRQEYITYGVNLTPACADFTQTRRSVYFTFAEINTGDYSWALVKDPLIASASSGYGLDRWRQEYGGSRIVNSAYRNPARNAAVSDAAQSRHMYGDAADLRNESRTEGEWQAMFDAAGRANADFREPRNGPCDIACAHADWRNHGGGYRP